ncbi:hypothetical protein ANCCAN_26638, partial [Ancylostoma caninum]
MGELFFVDDAILNFITARCLRMRSFIDGIVQAKLGATRYDEN